MGILKKNFFEVVKCGIKLIQPDRIGIWDVKKLSAIVYAPIMSKTTIKTNKKQMISSADTFF